MNQLGLQKVQATALLACEVQNVRQLDTQQVGMHQLNVHQKNVQRLSLHKLHITHRTNRVNIPADFLVYLSMMIFVMKQTFMAGCLS